VTFARQGINAALPCNIEASWMPSSSGAVDVAEQCMVEHIRQGKEEVLAKIRAADLATAL